MVYEFFSLTDTGRLRSNNEDLPDWLSFDAATRNFSGTPANGVVGWVIVTVTADDGSVHPAWERVQITYDMLAVDRAQTVLRYWNWSLSSAFSPELITGEEEEEDAPAQRQLAPAFVGELKRRVEDVAQQ